MQNLKKLLESNKGICLDIGAGEIKRPNFIGLDKRDLPGVDIVHDLEVFPYPLPDECCLTIVGSHIMEHIKPWLLVDVMNELWRIMKEHGRLALSMPYGTSFGYVQDPTHCAPWNQATFQYFDPSFPLYQIYKPKTWSIVKGFPCWQNNGNIECALEKVKEQDE